MAVDLAVHVGHRGGQAGDLLEAGHESRVEVRLRRLGLEGEHEGVPRGHEGLQVLVLAAEGHALEMPVSDVVGRGVVPLELLVDHPERLTSRQQVRRQRSLLGLEGDPARRLTFDEAGQGVGELAVQGAERVLRVALEVRDVAVLVLDGEDPLLGHVWLVA